MALLWQLRNRALNRLSSGLFVPVLAATTLVFLGSCRAGNDSPPDEILIDSLGLKSSDVVIQVYVGAVDGTEMVSPAELTIDRGTVVEFVARDRRMHLLRFALDSLNEDAADFLRSSGQDQSPPLLDRSARFVVTFEDAPAGRYPYVVEGTAEEGGGVVVVRP